MPKRPQKKSNKPDQQLPDQPVPPDHPDAMPEPGDIGLQAIATLDKHKKTVIIGTVLAAVALCVGLVGRQIADQRKIAAAEDYSAAAAERSIPKLDGVVVDHSGTPAAGNALLTKAEIQLSMEKAQDAESTLETFVEDYEKHPRYSQGLFALGNLHHNNDDAEKASQFYEQALDAEPDSDIAPMIVIRQGDLLLEEADQLTEAGKKEEAASKKEAARAKYEDSIRRINFRANRFIPIAEEKLAMLAVGDVPVVPAPPKPPEPPTSDPVMPTVPGIDPGPGANPVDGGFQLFDPEKPASEKSQSGAETSKPVSEGDAAAPAEKPKGEGEKPKKAKATSETQAPAPAKPEKPKAPGKGKGKGAPKAKADDAPQGKGKARDEMPAAPASEKPAQAPEKPAEPASEEPATAEKTAPNTKTTPATDSAPDEKPAPKPADSTPAEKPAPAPSEPAPAPKVDAETSADPAPAPAPKPE